VFFKIKQKFWENVPQEPAFICEVAKPYKILYLLYVSYALMNSVHKLKCKTNLTLLST